MEECYICLSNSGERRISPGPSIYEGKHWLVEHSYPCKIKGWLVIPTRKHVTTLHDLTPEESSEFPDVLRRTSNVLHKVLGTEKEYAAFFGEGKHFKHVHFHVIGKPHDLPEEYKGPKIFEMIRCSEEESVPAEEIKNFCELLKSEF